MKKNESIINYMSSKRQTPLFCLGKKALGKKRVVGPLDLKESLKKELYKTQVLEYGES